VHHLLTLTLESEAETERLGRRLAETLPEHACLALVGTLGAGKTRLARAIAAALGVSARDVTSPTFTLIQSYATADRRPLFHIDAYRVRDEDEWFELGIDELLESPALVMIEWADRFADSLPAETLWLTLELPDAEPAAEELSQPEEPPVEELDGREAESAAPSRRAVTMRSDDLARWEKWGERFRALWEAGAT
jgi:tRNA threonylcarbamoyladenosine biosynthesis protein TsaE